MLLCPKFGVLWMPQIGKRLLFSVGFGRLGALFLPKAIFENAGNWPVLRRLEAPPQGIRENSALRFHGQLLSPDQAPIVSQLDECTCRAGCRDVSGR